MIRRPPRSTRTDTLFPYTTRFRSAGSDGEIRRGSLDGHNIVDLAPFQSSSRNRGYGNRHRLKVLFGPKRGHDDFFDPPRLRLSHGRNGGYNPGWCDAPPISQRIFKHHTSSHSPSLTFSLTTFLP